MSDYTLITDSIIRTDTIIDDFIYRDGTIRIVPTATFQMGGAYYFSPTSSNNYVEKIYEGIKSRFAIEGGKAGLFEGFHFYNEYKPNAQIFFPCLIISTEETSETASSFFGGDYTYMFPITVEVAFKRDKFLITSDGTLSCKSLAEYYLFHTRKLFEETNYNSDYIKIGEMGFEDEIHEPREGNQTLYGFSLDAKIEYKLGD